MLLHLWSLQISLVQSSNKSEWKSHSPYRPQLALPACACLYSIGESRRHDHSSRAQPMPKSLELEKDQGQVLQKYQCELGSDSSARPSSPSSSWTSSLQLHVAGAPRPLPRASRPWRSCPVGPCGFRACIVRNSIRPVPRPWRKSDPCSHCVATLNTDRNRSCPAPHLPLPRIHHRYSG